MKICHIITRLIIGGAQENTLLTCEGLAARGHEVTLITGPQSGPEGSLLDEARGCGYTVRVVNTLVRQPNPILDLKARAQIRRLLGGLEPEIVHTHSSKAGILGRLAARDAKVPVIVHTIHGMSFNRTQPVWLRRLYRRAEAHCATFTHRILTVADALAEQAQAAGIGPADQFVTVYSGMRTAWYNQSRYDRMAVRQAWGIEDDAVVVGTVARLFRNKGYEQLIPAIALAHKSDPKLRFVWVGDGAQRQQYEHRLAKLGIRDRVHLTGLVEPRKVASLLAGMDFVVHASQWEGLPRVAVQASLMEKPVICFDIDGSPEVIIPDHTGVLVPLNDVGRLARAIVELASDPERRLRLGSSARNLCVRRFDHERMVDRIEAVYHEILK